MDSAYEELRFVGPWTPLARKLAASASAYRRCEGKIMAPSCKGQLMIMQDDHITGNIRDGLQKGNTAEAAILDTLNKYVEAFQKLSNPVFQERVYDIKDVCRRILWHLRPATPESAGSDDERLILLAHDASVMDLFSVDFERLAGIVVERGGPQSHAAILARSLGIHGDDR